MPTDELDFIDKVMRWPKRRFRALQAVVILGFMVSLWVLRGWESAVGVALCFIAWFAVGFGSIVAYHWRRSEPSKPSHD